jgi:hypothetical protein
VVDTPPKPPKKKQDQEQKQERDLRLMADKIRRQNVIKIRVSDDELAELRERKTCTELARWIRESILAGDVVLRSQTAAVDPQLLRSLAAIGNNVNQIARRLNSAKSTDIPIALELQYISNSLRELLEKHRVS